MQAWDEALHKFLALTPTEQTVNDLTDVIPFHSLCKTVLDTDVSPTLKEDLSTALRRCLQVQSVCKAYCLNPLDLAIIKYEGQATREECEAADQFLSFLSELVFVSDGSANRCLAAALEPILQSLTSISLMGSLSGAVKCLGTELVEKVILPLFDSDDVGVAEMARTAVKASIDGRMPYVIPQAQDHDPRVVPREKQDEFNEAVMKWQSQKLMSTDRDRLCSWISDAGILEALSHRLAGKAHLTARANNAPVDVVRVRAASLIIYLLEACPAFEAEARSSAWIATIVSTLYQTDDVLLRMSAAELVVTEILQSAAAIDHMWENDLCDVFLTDLKSADTDASLRWGLVRLLSNVVERVPKSREAILMKDKSLVKMLAAHFDDSSADFTHRPNAISAIGSIASGLNTIGVQALYADFPEWAQEYARILRSGTEAEMLAALTGVIRIAGGIPNRDAQPSVHDQRGLQALEEDLCPLITSETLKKPFPATRELCFQAFTALLMLGILTPLKELSANRELQKSIFAPPYDDPPNVCYAKHLFVQKALAMYGDWLKSQNADTTLLDAMNFYSQGGPYSTPPQYRDESVDIEEQVA